MIDQAEGRAPLQIQDQITPARLHVYNLRPICYDTRSKSGGGWLVALGTPARTAPRDLAIRSPRLSLTRPWG